MVGRRRRSSFWSSIVSDSFKVQSLDKTDDVIFKMGTKTRTPQ